MIKSILMHHAGWYNTRHCVDVQNGINSSLTVNYLWEEITSELSNWGSVVYVTYYCYAYA